MALPNRAFFTIPEAAIKWDCSPAHIVGWSAAEKLELVTSVALVRAGGEQMAGMMIVHGADILPLFRADKEAPETIFLHRIKEMSDTAAEWKFIESPERGIEIAKDAIFIAQTEFERFAREIGMQVSRKYAPPKYDWDAMYVALIRRIHNHGLPDTKIALINEMQEWFSRNSDTGEFPDERTMRARIYPVYDAIMAEED